MPRISRTEFHRILKSSGLTFETQNVDGLGTRLSSDYTDIVLKSAALPLLERICDEQRRSCIWPMVGTYFDGFTVRRITLYKTLDEE